VRRLAELHRGLPGLLPAHARFLSRRARRARASHGRAGALKRVWRRLRIIALLLVLGFVALETYFDRVYSTDWDIPLRVLVYPINGDGSEAAERFIDQLDKDAFRSLETF